MANFDRVVSSWKDSKKKATGARGKCGTCKKPVRLKKNGLLYKHAFLGTRSECMGSGHRPQWILTACLCGTEVAISLSNGTTVSTHRRQSSSVLCKFSGRNAVMNDSYRIVFFE